MPVILSPCPLAAATSIPGSRGLLALCLLGMLVAMYAGAWRGYWSGPIRQLAPTLALGVAALGAWLFGPELGHWVLKSTMVPWLLRGLAGMALTGSILWLGAFAVLWRLGRNKFPSKTGEAESPVLGAVIGCWTGILWSAVAFLLLAAGGAAAQFWLENTSNAPPSLGRTALIKLVATKNSLALINGAQWLETWNPLPDHTRRLFEKGLLVLNTPGAMSRLQDLPEIRSIATHPSFYPLTQDPEIRLLVVRRDIERLVSHPAVLRLMSDDDFQRLVASTNLERLFDQALLGVPRVLR